MVDLDSNPTNDVIEVVPIGMLNSICKQMLMTRAAR